MTFVENFKKINRKLIIITVIVILCLILGGVLIAKYTYASEIKKGLDLGNKYLQEQKYEEAILAFQKVIQVEPKNIEARVNLANAYINTAKIDEAEKILKEAIGINPKKVEPYLELAKLYISGNNQVNAIKILTDGYQATNDESIKAMLEDIKSKITVDNINKTITLGESYNLPNEVTVVINNVSAQFPVKWDTTVVDTTKAGTSTFNGTLENTDKVVKVTLNVVTIASIGDISNKINQNDKYSLPSKVTAKMTDNTTREVEVTWNPSTVDTSKVGTYSYRGTVSGYSSKVNLTLKVEEIYDPYAWAPGIKENFERSEFNNDLAKWKVRYEKDKNYIINGSQGVQGVYTVYITAEGEEERGYISINCKTGRQCAYGLGLLN